MSLSETTYWVYVLTNQSEMLYVGMTSDLERRMAQHETQYYSDAFTARYNLDRLVYAEPYGTRDAALQRERQLQSWPYEEKAALISADNPAWRAEAVT